MRRILKINGIKTIASASCFFQFLSLKSSAIIVIVINAAIKM